MSSFPVAMKLTIIIIITTIISLLIFKRKVVLVHDPHVRVVAPASFLLVRSDHAFVLGALSHLDVSRRSVRERGCRGRCTAAGFVDQPSGIRGEPLIDLLEAFAGRFDDEEVDDGDEGGVEDRVEQVEAPVEVVDADRGGLDDDVVEQPVAGGGQGGPLGAHAQRVDLGGIQPGGGDPAEAEGEEVEGYEHRRYDPGDVVALVVADLRADGDAEERDGHCCGH